jgi:glutamate synthase domain-containing protein 3
VDTQKAVTRGLLDVVPGGVGDVGKRVVAMVRGILDALAGRADDPVCRALSAGEIAIRAGRVDNLVAAEFKVALKN